MLEKMGHCVTEAHNGAAAVTANAAHIYDVILMDMQMPVMDGLDATRAIRAHENGGRHVPIIALTANAMSGDRDRCIEAGMDEYVSKPIEASALIAALGRVTAPPGADSRTPAPAAPAPAAPGAGAAPAAGTADHAAACFPYDRAAALERAAGDAELLAQIIEIYLQETPALLEQLGAFLDAGDAQQAFRSAHTIKGSSANLSAGEVTEAARAVELAARQGDLVAARAAYPRLQSATTLLIERLIAGHDGTHAACLACEETSGRSPSSTIPSPTC
jgi:CheY-like chemotaxis protein/HPt (histidine-containing phosphotransfer) domain-containing protein